MAHGRVLACLLFLAVTGFLGAFSPILRGVDLNDPHIIAHVTTGCFVMGLAICRLSLQVDGASAADYLLAVLGAWFALLPWTIPDTPGVGAAGEYHDHVHVIIGSLQAGAALWNALSISSRPARQAASPA